MRTGDAATDFAALAQRDDAAPGLACPLLSGHQVDVSLDNSATPQNVDHKLGRKLVGWFMVRGANPAFQPGDAGADDKVLKLVNASGNAQAFSIWVY